MNPSRPRAIRRLRSVAFHSALCTIPWACGGSAPEPRWIDLAEQFVPPPAAEIEPGGGLSVRADAAGDGFWVDYPLAPSAWKEVPGRRGCREWSTPRPRTAGLRHQDGERVELRAGGQPLREIEWLHRKDDPEPVGRGVFFLEAENLVLRLPAPEEPPAETVFSSWLERGERVDGTWRAVARELVADGLSVWPGERATIRCGIPPESVLRLSTLARGLTQGGRVRFRVLLDQDLLLDHEQSCEAGSPPARHLLELPRRGRPEATLAFEVEGDAAASVFANPVIGPARIGGYGKRPWASTRPDLVLFMADTLRADCLAAYGGDPELMPHLNELASRSVRFLQARSASVWTLPAHATLFTGLLPTQHGAVLGERTFSPELVTLAEHLQAHGYRTGAVTEAGFVSRHFDMDQGFEWFEERLHGRLSGTLASALEFLERDDGRPVFLFVHTYRVHEPYRSGPEEDRTGTDELVARVLARMRAWDRQGELRDLLAEFADECRGLYLEGARGLDELFGPFLARLEESGVLDRGYLVFTSDHGEAFFEHGDRGHRLAPHEEKIRIPLFLHGPGLAPREVDLGTNLIDLCPTLADLTGLPRLAGWVGESLLQVDRERSLFSYNQDEEASYLAVVQGRRKLLARCGPGLLSRALLESGEALDSAFELGADPEEREDLLHVETWPLELSRSIAPSWESIAQPVAATSTVELTDELADGLRALGYAK